MSKSILTQPGHVIAAAVRNGEVSAREVTQATLARIDALNPTLCALTNVTSARALQKAGEIDQRRGCGDKLGALAGVPYSVKNLYDVEGVVTRAGSLINRDNSAAKADATLVAQLDKADAVLVGCANMGEYAYDFTGENVHDGPSRNPHDLAHMSGGSSGGSGAAVAAGLSAISLGSDTNGSIRVPSAFCGLFGLKPTYGRLSRSGTFPFVSSFDHLGPLARSPLDLALSYDAMQGADPSDPMQSTRSVEPTAHVLEKGAAGLRIACVGGYFATGAEPGAFAAVDTVAKALGAAVHSQLARAGPCTNIGLSHHDGRGRKLASAKVTRKAAGF